jgi:hypothetical protein
MWGEVGGDAQNTSTKYVVAARRIEDVVEPAIEERTIFARADAGVLVRGQRQSTPLEPAKDVIAKPLDFAIVEALALAIVEALALAIVEAPQHAFFNESLDERRKFHFSSRLSLHEQRLQSPPLGDPSCSRLGMEQRYRRRQTFVKVFVTYGKTYGFSKRTSRRTKPSLRTSPPPPPHHRRHGTHKPQRHRAILIRRTCSAQTRARSVRRSSFDPIASGARGAAANRSRRIPAYARAGARTRP